LAAAFVFGLRRLPNWNPAPLIMTRTQKIVSANTADRLLKIFWPDFVRVNGCVFAAFHWFGTYSGNFDDKTQTEAFINHTHILDEFRNSATFRVIEPASKDLDEIEEIYDAGHPDFLHACKIGKAMARMWAVKLKVDFPVERFRVYYTQCDNPIVRFHKVRSNEPVWLHDEDSRIANDPSFREILIYDTDRLDLRNAEDFS
jgi:hypothetical protein